MNRQAALDAARAEWPAMAFVLTDRYIANPITGEILFVRSGGRWVRACAR